MALLLCEGINKACQGLCEIINIPCRLCCKGCRLSCDCFCQALTSPFFPYLAVTCAFNFPPTIWGIQSVVNQCNGSTGYQWLTVNAVLTAIHILAAFYIVHRIQADATDHNDTTTDATNNIYPMKGSDPEKGTGTSSSTTPFKNMSMTMTATRKEGAASSWHRVTKILSYDVGVAIYIIVFLVWIGWQSHGLHDWLVNGENGGGGGEGMCQNGHKWQINSLILGWVYMMMVVCSFCCSLVCLRPV